MRLHLSYQNSGSLDITLANERIPSHVLTISTVKCKYELVRHSDYYHLTLETLCQLSLCCQRCMEAFDYLYHNTTDIGLCDNDEVAERIMETLEPVVLNSDEIPFATLILDELYLYLPLFHEDEQQCHPILSSKSIDLND